ncbi:TonB-dependent receptor [Arcobacter lacus]|uniref:TonB-dependent receptor n=1 Tax=Arcobacter lacus TaxID=1912876 RepID=UPI0021BB322C|nr:TonB-dependent receptor [Arcobacter lacus]MCT7911412.1 TonB-dependent receptor [Arcobacter lacus]
MKFSKHALVASSLALVFGVNLFADEVYTIQNKTLKEALEIISKKSNLSYIANDEILETKKVNSIENIEGTQKALDKILEGTGLKAIIQNEAIVIIKEKTIGKGTVLEPISVNDSYKNGTAENGYLVEETSAIGIWNDRKLQDTPYSMSIISKELIENVQAKDMQQIFKMNSTTQESSKAAYGNGDSSFPTMRGFSVYNPIINGISYANQSTSIPMIQDIERVEIISGATGFLYGGGRVGGAVNYITKKPTTEDLRNVSIGSYGNESYYTHLDLGGQFDENHTFGYRINGFYQDGELPNESEKEQKSINLVFDWKPTDNFYTDIKYSYKNTFTKGGTTDFSTWQVEKLDRASIKKNKSYNPDWLESEIKSDKFEHSIKYDINDIFTVRTNLFYEEMKYRGDYSELLVKEGIIKGNYSSYLARSAWSKSKNYGASLFLDSKFDTGSISHALTMGYSLSSHKSYTASDQWAYYDFIDDISLNDLKNLPKPDDSLWTNQVGTQPRKPGVKTQYKNILIGDDIVFNHQWSALVGVNYATTIQKSYRANTKYDESELTPTLSLMYKPIENFTTYATYIESLELGTIVGNTYANENEVLDPYKSTQYEVGAKYSLFDEKALLTTSLFRIEKANSYTDNSTVATLGKPKLTKDGEQIHQGIEIGITGKVTDNFTLMGGVTFMDLSVEKVTDPTLKGKKPTNAASKMAKIYAEYQIPYIERLYLSAGAYYTGKSYGNNENTDIMPSYTLYDAGLRYKTRINKYPTTFLLNVANLTDEDYWASGNYLGDPRSVAFSMKMEF